MAKLGVHATGHRSGAADTTAAQCPAVGRDAVFSVTVPAGKELTVEASSPTFAADVGLYARSSCTGAELDCVDDSDPATSESLMFTNPCAAPVTSLVFVDSDDASDADTVSVTFTSN